MSRYITSLIIGVICILVATSCDRDKDDSVSGEDPSTKADASQGAGGGRADATSPDDKENSGNVGGSGPVESDGGTSDNEPEEDAGPTEEPKEGECSPEGATEECYSGPSSTRGVGICEAGTQTCENGEWGPCEGMVTREEETCDGRDEDCDGETDEDLSLGSCVPEGMTEEELENECLSGQLICKNGSTVCELIDNEQEEQCNGIDDDCDGETDEDVDTTCYTGSTGCTEGDDGEWQCQGICRVGSQQCIDGELSEQCLGEVTPRPSEMCYARPAVDDDCDGEVDETCSCTPGDTQECYTGPAETTGVGECRNGEQTCSRWGFWGFCTGQILPTEETCENAGEDNDCDGDANEVPTGEYCLTGLSGRCRDGSIECDGNETVCVPDNSPVAEQCNRVDDDCDGETDEDFDLDFDEQHCGNCWTRCWRGQECCDGWCVDLNSDENNCGQCGNACDPGASCVNGSCGCPPGTINCPPDGCVSPTTDEHCGGCSSCGSNESCVNRTCQCDSGYQRCDGNCVNTQTNPDYCGDCSTECPDNSYCSGGSCHCDEGYTQCPDQQCYDLNNDRSHCGSCSRDCGSFANCVDGECQCTTQGYIFCPGDGCVDPTDGRCGCGSACLVGEECVLDTGSGNYVCQVTS